MPGRLEERTSNEGPASPAVKSGGRGNAVVIPARLLEARPAVRAKSGQVVLLHLQVQAREALADSPVSQHCEHGAACSASAGIRQGAMLNTPAQPVSATALPTATG